MDQRPPAYASPQPSGSGSALPWIVVAIIAIVGIVVVGAAAGKVGPFNSSSSSNTSSTTSDTVIPASAWTAVFLGDNEVFFGHLKSINSDQIELSNVFYLQKTAQGGSSATSQASQLSLASLVSNQIQCPTDDIVLNRASVLYYQQLQPASYVVSKLTSLLTQPANCVQPTTPTPTPAKSAN